MPVSREKITQLSHTVTDELARHRELVFHEDHNAVRLHVRAILESLLRVESQMDEAVRRKIDSQKRHILEGTEEWDILYRKYYVEEMKKLGV